MMWRTMALLALHPRKATGDLACSRRAANLGLGISCSRWVMVEANMQMVGGTRYNGWHHDEAEPGLRFWDHRHNQAITTVQCLRTCHVKLLTTLTGQT